MYDMYAQVLEDRGEMGSRHGRATFSVLLLQVWQACPFWNDFNMSSCQLFLQHFLEAAMQLPGLQCITCVQ
jgi:hypothetical protein